MFVLIMALGWSSARAQSWLVVPTYPGDEPVDSLDADVRELVAALEANGASAWDPGLASRRYESEVSAAPPQLSESEIQRFIETSNRAVRHLARADYEAARADLLEAQQLSERAAEELNREISRAREVLDTCLFVVRAFLETGDRQSAAHQAAECRRLVPRVEPSVYRHTPEVRALLSDVDAELATQPVAQLRVTSEPVGCEVRLNGLEFGFTPMGVDGLYPGRYRLQVECPGIGQRGRVHRVELSDVQTEIHVNARAESVIESEYGVRLHYATDEDEELNRVEDARSIAETLRADRILLMHVEGHRDSYRLDVMVRESGRVLASVWVAHDRVVDGVSSVLDAESVDFRGLAPVEALAWNPPDAAASRSPVRRSSFIGGVTMVALAVAASFVSVGLHVRRGNLGDRYALASDDAPEFLRLQKEWLDLRAPVLVAALGGATLGVVGSFLAAPARERVPIWAWAVGGLGLGAMVYALYEGLTLTGCSNIADDRSRCVDRGQEIDRAVLVASVATRLLAIPVAFAVHRSNRELGFVPHRHGAGLYFESDF